MRHRRSLVLAFGLCAVVLPTQTVSAVNEFSQGAIRAGSPIYDGLKGNQNIRTDIATVSGVAYVHITQIDTGTLGGDFVAIGTVKGAGTTSGNCTTHAGPGWTGYYDGRSGGVYFCENFDANAYPLGSNPSFELLYQFCPAVGNRWTFFFNGSLRTCKSSGGSDAGVALIAGLETVGPNGTDRNIDVKYSNLMRNTAGSTSWLNLGDTRPGEVDPNYSYTYTSTTKFDVYLAPLN